MKKVILVSSVFIYAVFLSACSCNSDVVIVNNSTEAIQISYRAKSYYHFTAPKIATKDEFKGTETNWHDFPGDMYELNQENKTVKLQLGPNQVLLLERIGEDRDGEDLSKEMDLDELKIVGNKGHFVWKGEEIHQQFKPERNSLAFFGPSCSSYVYYY